MHQDVSRQSFFKGYQEGEAYSGFIRVCPSPCMSATRHRHLSCWRECTQANKQIGKIVRKPHAQLLFFQTLAAILAAVRGTTVEWGLQDAHGAMAMLKLKDFPPRDDFAEVLPRHNMVRLNSARHDRSLSPIPILGPHHAHWRLTRIAGLNTAQEGHSTEVKSESWRHGLVKHMVSSPGHIDRDACEAMGVRGGAGLLRGGAAVGGDASGGAQVGASGGPRQPGHHAAPRRRAPRPGPQVLHRLRPVPAPDPCSGPSPSRGCTLRCNPLCWQHYEHTSTALRPCSNNLVCPSDTVTL